MSKYRYSGTNKSTVCTVSFHNSRTSTFDDFRDQLMTANKRIALVTFARARNNGRELTVAKGEYLEVMDDDRQWWKCRNKGGEVGYVPHTIVKAIVYQDVSGVLYLIRLLYLINF